MYPVTHMTIAVGSVWLGEKLWRRLRGSTGESASIDYRFAALGSQIPDLVDKPLKYYIFPDTLPDSHVYGHTLLLPVCIILIGLLFARRGDLRLLVLGLGCLTHPLVDPTNTYPRTLFWPLFGTEFPVSRQDYRGYFQIPLDIVLIATFAIAVSRSERWRERALVFVRTGAFPFADDQPTSARSHR
jgi:membrane-bound metal-dependent hydrolase YbcI (DUF457 family)